VIGFFTPFHISPISKESLTEKALLFRVIDSSDPQSYRMQKPSETIPEFYWYYAGYLFVLNINEFSDKLYLSSFKIIIS
jgi:hypothetical protein